MAQPAMTNAAVAVLLVGLTDEDAAAIAAEDGFSVRRAADLRSLPADAAASDAIVLALGDVGPLDALRDARRAAPDAALVVVTEPGRDADGTVARHAGAEDHLPRTAALLALLPRAVRYAVEIRRVRRELATVDDATGLPNLRGFAAIAEHYLRMADRLGQTAVFVFVRLEDYGAILRETGPDAADTLARDAAGVILEAVRDADLPARIGPDTICVLLTGDAEGAETAVLSRLVEAIATHDARRDSPRALTLAVGTARYVPGSGASLAEILSSAVRGLSVRHAD